MRHLTTLALALLLSACAAPDPAPTGSNDGPATSGEVGFEDFLAQKLGPEMAAGWRAPIDGGGVRQAWLIGPELVIERDSGQVVAIHREDGRVLFTHQLDDGKRLVRRPARSENMVHLVVNDGGIVSLDRVSDELKKTFSTVTPGSDPSAIGRARDDQLLYLGGDGKFHAHTVAKGVGTTVGPPLKAGTVSWSVVGDGELYMTTGDGRVYALSLAADTMHTELWDAAGIGPVVARPLLSGRLLFTASAKGVCCYDTGSQQRSWSLAVDGPKDQLMMADADNLYVVGAAGLQAISKTGASVRWSAEGVEQLLCLGDGRVYARKGSQILMLSAADGSVLRTVDTGDRVSHWVSNGLTAQLIVGAEGDGVTTFYTLSEPE